MHLGADMMGDQSDDALAIGGKEALTRIGQAFRQPIDPQPPVRV
jgi:hypothetical protein